MATCLPQRPSDAPPDGRSQATLAMTLRVSSQLKTRSVVAQMCPPAMVSRLAASASSSKTLTIETMWVIAEGPVDVGDCRGSS